MDVPMNELNTRLDAIDGAIVNLLRQRTALTGQLPRPETAPPRRSGSVGRWRWPRHGRGNRSPTARRPFSGPYWYPTARCKTSGPGGPLPPGRPSGPP